MDKALQQRLLSLNRSFYATIAEPFDATRLAPSAGKNELIRRLPLDAGLSLADIGCGNGRLAWLLEERALPLEYIGVDANAQLLALAQAHTGTLRFVRTRFIEADLAQPNWPTRLTKPGAGFDVVTCLATLHHLPGYDLRCATLQRLAALVRPGGMVAISTWQFLTAERFRTKQVDWAEVGVDATQVEPGDALLPWKQGHYAVRFVHQIDLDEVTALAAAAGLTLTTTYRADGKEGNLNLYALLHRPHDAGSNLISK